VTGYGGGRRFAQTRPFSATDWPTHPAADLFPMLDGDELQSLADDIAVNGLMEPLTLYDDPDLGVTLLDGRNRLAACRLAVVEPATKYYDGPDPVRFVVSENIHRRHLTTGQRAMLALDMEELYAEQAALAKVRAGQEFGRGSSQKDPLPEMESAEKLEADLPQAIGRAPQARDRAATTTGTSGRAVAQAKRVAKQAPDLAKKVKTGELALDAAEKQAKRRQAQQQEQAAREIMLESELSADAEGGHWRLLHGDFRQRLADLPDGCIDLIVTDPPYPAEFLPLWADLAEHAHRLLSDQGILVALTGQVFLDRVIGHLSGHLNYAWCYVQPLPGANSRIMGQHILQTWKPWLAYTKGTWPAGRIDWHPDTLDPSTRNKDQYRWAQGAEPAEYLITELCPPGGTVVDPFAGSGAFGKAALALGRRFIGADLDPESAKGSIVLGGGL
jgi:16S rRNA G966 N2-methylase RsmD